MTVLDNRRENLRRLIEQWHGPGPLAAKLGYSNASFLVQMAGPNPTREVTEKTARKIELALNLPRLWMDEAPEKQGTVPKVDTRLLTETVKIVGTLAADLGVSLSPDKLADFVALAYEDAQEHGGLRSDFISRVLQLLR